MKKAIAAILLGIVFVVAHGQTTRVSTLRLEYVALVEAHEKVTAVRTNPKGASREEALAALSDSCTALVGIMKSGVLEKDFLASKARSPDEQKSAQLLLHKELLLFVNEFLSPESELLGQAQVSEQGRLLLIAYATEFRARPGKPAPIEDVVKNIYTFTDKFCSVVKGTLADKTATDDANLRKALGLGALGLGGTLFVIVDLPAAFVTAGASALSIQIGSGAVITALAGLATIGK